MYDKLKEKRTRGRWSPRSPGLGPGGWRRAMREHRNRAGGAGRSEISEGILQEFLALCKIPHQTGHEQEIGRAHV